MTQSQPDEISSYIPALDGLRAVSVLAVMGFHAGIPFLGGGFLGVDVFFVLSGFLITSLMVQEFDEIGHVSLKNFYMRRVLRLAPALFAVLVVFLAGSYLFAPVAVTRHHEIEALITLFYGVNWVRAFSWFPMDYLGHAWSLSIEEQFYLLWPAILLGLLKLSNGRRKTVLSAVLILFFLSWAWRAFLWEQGASLIRIYNGLDTHADGLILGSALGLMRASKMLSGISFLKGGRGASLLSCAVFACLLLLFSFADWQSRVMYVAGFALVNILVTMLVTDALLNSAGCMARMLRAGWLVWIGKLSYGLYLWHYPVYRAIQDSGFGENTLRIAGPALSLLIACISFYWLERPVLRYKQRYVSRRNGIL